MVQQDKQCLCSSRNMGLIQSLAQWVKDPVLLQLWCRLQLRLGFYPWPGNSMCRGCGHRKKKKRGVPVVAQRKQIRLGTMRWRIQLLTLLSVLRILCCQELWCGSQTWLGSGIAVAVAEAGGYRSNWTPTLAISICRGCGPKKTRKKKKERERINHVK